LEFDHKEIWWYDFFYDKLYSDSNITKFNLGRKLFNKRAITFLSIEENEIEAVIYDGRKYSYDVKIQFSLISYNEIDALLKIFREDTHHAIDLINGIFTKELQQLMTDRNIDIFPSWDEFNYKCSCRKTKKCEHTATVLHRLFNEIIFEPLLLFNLRGLKNSELFAIFMNDPDFSLSETTLPEGMKIDNYKVKSSDFNASGIEPSRYYGVEIPEIEMNGIRTSGLADSKVYHGKIREEFYEIYDSMSELLKINTKKF